MVKVGVLIGSLSVNSYSRKIAEYFTSLPSNLQFVELKYSMPGQDSEFILYDDEGDGYGYESGESVMIPVSWNDSDRLLTIGNQTGSYPTASNSRKFIIKVGNKTKDITYHGKTIRIRL